MSAQVVVEAGIGEIRAALVEDGRLSRLAIERDAGFDPGADIVLGRVGASARRMKSAEIALPGGAIGRLRRGDAKRPVEGASMILQIERQAHGRKGPRVGAEVAIAGRFLVYRPDQAGIGLARGTKDAPGLTKRWAKLAKSGGFQLRPAIAGATDQAVQAEAARLLDTWRCIEREAAPRAAPALLLADEPPVLRLLRDAPMLERILVDDSGEAARLKAALATLAPDLADKVLPHRGGASIFAADDIEGQIAEALERRIELPGGVALAIEPTEALTAIDIDVGDAVDLVGACRQAADEIARQVALRRIGGQVVVDFPRLGTDAARRKLADYMRARLADDPEPIEFGGLTRLGLVEFTRRRRGPTLGELLGAPERDFAPSLATLSRALLRRGLAESRNRPGRSLVLLAAAPTILRLQGEDRALLEALRARIGVGVSLQAKDWPPDRLEARADG